MRTLLSPPPMYLYIFFSSFHSLIKVEQVMIGNKIDWIVAGLLK